ncbi:hypothetical protein VNO77_16479 [Canavalia gladiata]|uniref:Uncharacterized protein n=1 Tax=Canavalia gladiata TaxID=3824 RepID=A0AAN9M1T5_CANGL
MKNEEGTAFMQLSAVRKIQPHGVISLVVLLSSELLHEKALQGELKNTQECLYAIDVRFFTKPRSLRLTALDFVPLIQWNFLKLDNLRHPCLIWHPHPAHVRHLRPNVFHFNIVPCLDPASTLITDEAIVDAAR